MEKNKRVVNNKKSRGGGIEHVIDPRMLCRRQFILGPHFVERFPSWNRLKITDSLYLTSHPDLNSYSCRIDDVSITLIGYLIDSLRPDDSDKDIIDRLAQELHTHKNPLTTIKSTYSLGGRWVLIIDIGKEIFLFNDPVGLRTVFFAIDVVKDNIWCATQPITLASILNFEIDDIAKSEFLDTEVCKAWNELIWPADKTAYKEITHLLPNHLLNLLTGNTTRFWPDQRLESTSFDKGIDITAYLLANLIKGAAKRFELALAITAGWDSRMLLAASKDFRHSIFYFSLFRRPNDIDCIIPSKILKKVGVKHTVIKYPKKMDHDFSTIFNNSVTEPHELWGKMAQGIAKHYPEDSVCIKGNASEIARVRFRLPPEREITAEHLAGFSYIASYSPQLENNPFVRRAWQNWISKMPGIFNIHLLDLFYWEQWGGNFSASTQNEWDIIHEVFTPYNCRNLLMTMLSVDEKYRDHDNPLLYKECILKLWPEVMCEPVNPKRKLGIGEKMRRTLIPIKASVKSLSKNLRLF